MSCGSDASEKSIKPDWTAGMLPLGALPEEMQRGLLNPNKPIKELKPDRLPSYRVKLRRERGEPSVATMFRDRMAREGRSTELKERVREVISQTGMGYAAALRVVMPQMGFINEQMEIRLHRDHREQYLRDSVESAIESAAKVEEETAALSAEERRELEAEREFEDALVTLPPNAPKSREIDWIEAHPAMMRQSRMKATGKTGPVLITAKDILLAPHGPCPSRAAAVQLQHWANNATKFFEQIMSEAKKKSSDGAGGAGTEGEVDDDLSEVEGLLDF